MERTRKAAAESSTGADAGTVTALLAAWTGGEARAEEALFERVLPVLRGLANRQLRAAGPVTLQVTELVGETYLRLLGERRVSWKNRGQFYSIVARCVRRVLIDHLRRRGAAKRGGNELPIELDTAGVAAPSVHPDLLALDEALIALAELDAEAARIVELRYFAGLTTGQIAASIGMGRTTVERRWRFARCWLRDTLQEGEGRRPAAAAVVDE